ncbi:MAG: DUF6851 domain-containing protein [Cyclobacteriaceae bacterium]
MYKEGHTNLIWSKAKVVSKILCTILLVASSHAWGQQSVARQWNEVLLESIRNDLARPTVHARNLFHISAAMYDAWAAYDPTTTTWLLGKTHGDYICPFDGVPDPSDIKEARQKAMSYAAYNLIVHRFEFSPGATTSIDLAKNLMSDLGYDLLVTDDDYSNGDPASLGNYIAQSMIDFGLQDGSNEIEDYRNKYYEPFNPPMLPKDSGNPFIIDPNRWQPLFLDTFIDQSGNVIPIGLVDFQSPEWGNVVPFALRASNLTVYERDDNQYRVYHDPGPPPYLQEDDLEQASEYHWGFNLVSIWGAHLDPSDGVMWDISPASIGSISDFPTMQSGLREFYQQLDGGDIGLGHDLNPITGAPYPPQMVPRGDYSRVLAEFWADGPESETPPGHWFVILNYVSDHPLLEKKFRGNGPELDALEWDVKAYFALGGAVHDAAISAWSIKGWYDYIRPVSAIRYLAEQGQSSDQALPNYNLNGIKLVDGYIEQVKAGDPLAGVNGENIDKIKLYSWRGPDYIQDPVVDFAGVDWILAENWWPYQRPTFVTPPFAGYVSGHSTFSRAAAEVMTLLTGDDFFPGGIGEFVAKKNEFLVFEEGPSVDVVLQWATYRDASDQTSLSRIWGGIHPPADDIPGRIIGEKVGIAAFNNAERYFDGIVTALTEDNPELDIFALYPNPVKQGSDVKIIVNERQTLANIEIIHINGRKSTLIPREGQPFTISTEKLDPGFYVVRKITQYGSQTAKLIVK